MIWKYESNFFAPGSLLPCEASLSMSMDKPPGPDITAVPCPVFLGQLAVDGMVHVSSGALQPVFYALIAWLGYLNTFSHGFSITGVPSCSDVFGKTCLPILFQGLLVGKGFIRKKNWSRSSQKDEDTYMLYPKRGHQQLKKLQLLWKDLFIWNLPGASWNSGKDFLFISSRVYIRILLKITQEFQAADFPSFRVASQ